MATTSTATATVMNQLECSSRRNSQRGGASRFVIAVRSPIFTTIGNNGTGEGILVAKIRRQPVDRVFLPSMLRSH